MGIPLIQGAVGQEGVLYACVYIVVFQALLWSHGIVTVKGGIKARSSVMMAAPHYVQDESRVMFVIYDEGN